MQHILDNPAWNALNSGNSQLSYGNGEVKYFDREVSPFVGFKHNTDNDFKTLYDILPHKGPAGFISMVERELPPQWQTVAYVKCAQMVFDDGLAPANVAIPLVPLTQVHVPQMLALTKLTNPGPFKLKTIDFGHYYGVFDGDTLVAMAGQRMHPLPYAEISAVCTHPDYLGRSYAKQLLLFHIKRIIDAGNIPMLHVRHDNERAIKVYQSVGFNIRRDVHIYIMNKVV